MCGRDLGSDMEDADLQKKNTFPMLPSLILVFTFLVIVVTSIRKVLT